MHAHNIIRLLQALTGRGEHQTRRREYDAVMHAARLLGHDEGMEWCWMSHHDDPPIKAPDESLWMRWSSDMPEQDRKTALLFNAQMSFATARAVGYAEAAEIQMWDSVEKSLRGAAQ
jgi:hypothetical protein